MITMTELRKQHRALMSLMVSLTPTEPLSPQDAERLRYRLTSLEKRVKEHFAEEDPVVEDLCGAPPGSVRRLAGETRRREAQALAEASESFARHWKQPGVIERNVGSFASSVAVLRGSLDRLVKREEDEIYPLTASMQAAQPATAPSLTGFAELDEDHAAIFALIGGLRAAVGGGQSRLDGAQVAELAGYAERHFAREEAIMEATAYPGIEDHRREHHQARAILMGFRNDHLDGRLVGAGEVLAFLERWLGSHIESVDMRMAEHARSVDPRRQ